jgi:thiamine biosynthesis protein ThiS
MERSRSFDNGRPLLVAVSSIATLNRSPASWAAALYAGGVDIIQIREPSLSEDAIRTLLKDVIAAAPTLKAVQINNRPDLAIEFGCGLHLPASAEAEMVTSSPASRSIHDVVETNAPEGVDFLVAGHIFDTPSHLGTPGKGLNWLHEITTASSLPVVAIGGVDAGRVADCMSVGAAGVAVIRALSETDDPWSAAQRLRTPLDAWAASHPERAWRLNVSDYAEESSIAITLNGKPEKRPAGSTITDLLTERSLMDRLVVVEVNGQIVPRALFSSTVFNAGDTVEMVHFVGGG